MSHTIVLGGAPTTHGGINCYFDENTQSIIECGMTDFGDFCFNQTPLIKFLQEVEDPEAWLFLELVKNGLVDRDICVICGQKLESNYIPSLDSDQEKIDGGVAFWWGKGTCAKCDELYYNHRDAQKPPDSLSEST